MKLYMIRTTSGDDFETPLHHIVRVYRDRGKITFTDGAVIRMAATDIDRLKIAMEMEGRADNPYI